MSPCSGALFIKSPVKFKRVIEWSVLGLMGKSHLLSLRVLGGSSLPSLFCGKAHFPDATVPWWPCWGRWVLLLLSQC